MVYRHLVPNQRKPGQKLLTLPASEEFIAAMDAGLAELGCGNRSSFIREAIIEKLQREHVRVPKALAAAPARFGQHPAPRSPAYEQKEISSAPARPRTADEAAAAEEEQAEAQLRKPATAAPTAATARRARRK